MKLLIRLVLGFVVASVLVVASLLAYVRLALPKVPPAPVVTITPTPELLARGEYLFNHVAVCVDCHSTRDATRFAGPVLAGTEGKGGERFGPEIGLPGTYFAANLTPAALGDWSDGEILRAVTAGVDRVGEPYFPIMPYPAYARTSQTDLEAIIAYMRTLRPIENEVSASAHAFPMNFIVRIMPREVALAPTPPPATDTVAYGAYLTTMAACSDCHTPFVKGQPDFSRFLAGGRDFPLPTGGVAHSRNLTPDPVHGLGAWTKEQFIARFKAHDPATQVADPVEPGHFNTVMPWAAYAGMTEADLAAIYDFLRTVPPVANEIVAFSPPAE